MRKQTVKRIAAICYSMTIIFSIITCGGQIPQEEAISRLKTHSQEPEVINKECTQNYDKKIT